MTSMLSVYIPTDRRHALAQDVTLPERTSGAALFADISGFTPLTEALVREFGPRGGAEELTRQLNLVYDVLIAKVHRYGGSVIGFAGDAITCWFAGDTRDGLQPSDSEGQALASLRAVMRTAPYGQSTAHRPQPLQLSRSTVAGTGRLRGNQGRISSSNVTAPSNAHSAMPE